MRGGLAIASQAGAFQNWFAQPDRAAIIVVGNEKGGSGKSTTAIHLTIGLLKQGCSVGCIDLDMRQASLTHFVANRARLAAAREIPLALPELRRLDVPERIDGAEDRARALREFAAAIERLQRFDYIVIDTPGADSFLSNLGHVVADTLITPLNESYLDLDVLIRLDSDGHTILGASTYAHSVLARSDRRRDLGGPPTEWFIMRARRAHLESRNRRQVDYLLDELSKRIGFRLLPGLSERVVYRELFAQGLTVLDIEDDPHPRTGDASRLAARQEINALVHAITGGAPSRRTLPP